MAQLLFDRLRLAQDNLIELTVYSSESRVYTGYVENWDDNGLVLKYVGSDKDDPIVVERWIDLSTVFEIAYTRGITLEESYLNNNHESSLRFADDNPNEQSDVIVDEIMNDFDDDTEQGDALV